MQTTLALPRIYWTKQHGAYITLITSWIIAVIICGFNWLQLPAIIFLLSSINVVELFTEELKRKSPMPAYKISSKYFYIILSAISGLTLLIYSNTFRQLIPILAIFPLIFIYLAKKRKQKSLGAEFFTFIFFVITSFIGSVINSWTPVIIAMIIMILFFGSSVLTVKQRFGRIDWIWVFVYMIASILIVLFLTHETLFGYVVCFLLVIKTIGSWGFTKWYSQLKIKHIGMIESLVQAGLVISFLALG